MKIGDFITCKLYLNKGKGIIIEINIINNEIIYNIFFEKTKEILSLNSKNIEKIKNPIEKIIENSFDNLLLFPIKILSEEIFSLFYQKKIISANNISIIPLPHQILTVNNVLEQFTPRCLIADEVGLGKTIEAALIYEELKIRGLVKRILIVTPSGLSNQWKNELKTKFNEDFVLLNKDTFNGFQTIYGEKNVWKSFNKVITSIDFLKPQPLNDNLSQMDYERRIRHNEYITNNCVMSEWDMVIFDEAHNLSKTSEGVETARYKLGKLLSDAVPILLLLTATPHQGDSVKFRHLLKLIDPYKFYSKDSLTPENVSSVIFKNNKRAAIDFNGNTIFKNRFPFLIKIYREEGDIEKQLYDKVTEYVSEYYDLAAKEKNFPIMFLLIIYQRMVSSSSKAIYKSLNKRLSLLKNNLKAAYYFSNINFEDYNGINLQEAFDKISNTQNSNVEKINKKFHNKSSMKYEINILENCVVLAQKASKGRQDFKMRKLLEVIDKVIFEERNTQTKFIIFTEFIETQNYIKEVLENMGYSISLFNGRMNLEEKIKAKSQFKRESQFLITTDSGGEGINLQFCHVMINYDLPWNPMKIEQRIGRIDRIGQTNDVKIFNFVLEDTVEEKVRSVLDSKLDLIAEEFGDDKRNDILSLISDENNFDQIYLDTIKNKNIKNENLDKIGASIYNQAKEVLSNQDFLVPFSKTEDNRKIKSYMINDESNLIKNFVMFYAKFKNVKIEEYSNRKDVFYFKDYLDGYKLKNVVFDRKKAFENEEYEYLNFNHIFVKTILSNITSQDSLSFLLVNNNYFCDVSGTLFYYRFELTNNEGFIRRKIVPIFLNEDGFYDVNVSMWFKNLNNFDFKMGNVGNYKNFKKLVDFANNIKDKEMKDFKSDVELELLEKLNNDRKKFDKYFSDKELAINNIAIENIRIKQLENLKEQRIKEMDKFIKKKNLVPKINLFLVAKIKLFKGD